MDRFFIITNTKKDPEYRFTKMLKDYLLLNGKKCIQIPTEAYENRKRLFVDLNPKTDCLLVIGGDGSVLRAAHLVLGSGVPILGINLGTLGYLAEVEKGNWQEMIGLVLHNRGNEEHMRNQSYLFGHLLVLPCSAEQVHTAIQA